ncbi:Tfp pilus assembly protein PilF [Aliiruegeria haliotis]|uniref:Tfp pilus assembly protein PilF n=1 Tax=Aliiruegeria haliotis TaxID=1280846 RepID=A0A2T0RYP8_9RHOB|nr:sulfotransferase [Aliiruegeria haliotis]PRY26262.1 Tfp pilus assembly protein PilF [Aliiruegeria haliotis]
MTEKKTFTLPEALERAAFLAKRPQRHAEAAAVYRAILARVPDHAEARTRLAALIEVMAAPLNAPLERIRGLMDRGQWAQAQQALDGLMRENPQVPLLPNLKGIVLAQQGMRGKAIDCFRSAISIAPEYAEAYNNLATTLRQSGKAQMALPIAEKATNLRPEAPAYRAGLGQILADLGRPEDALAAFEAALEVRPDMLAAHDGICGLHAAAGDVDALRAALDRAEGAMDAPAAPLRIRRAQMHVMAGEDQEAIDTLQLVRPGNLPPEARISRAEMLASAADRTGQTELAFDSFTEANRAAMAIAHTSTGEDNPYLQTLAARLDDIARTESRPWPVEAGAEGAPVFVLGVPPTGSLLANVLRDHPGTSVVVEQDLLRPVRNTLDDPKTLAELAALSDDKLAEARRAYSQAFEAAFGGPPTGLRVDATPLNLGDAALIHRVFPGARFVLALRHPAAAVFDAWAYPFRSNAATDNALTLHGSAQLYDRLMSLWTRTAALLDLPVVETREDAPDASVEALFGGLGLEAAGDIPLSPGAEPRWKRYEAKLADIQPDLARWIAHWGYTE